ncbi:MAG: uncharacterized protein QG628_227 [Patescibacteria group bacterium]|nr:uncharacterized protein [Patescibacteria group bacterium]
MVGIPGAGKTTASKLIAEITGATHIWADHERRIMWPEPGYTPEENETLYVRLNTKAEALLRGNHSVVYDTAFNHYQDRQKLREIAKRNNAEVIVIWVQAPKDIAKLRAQNVHEHSHTRVLGNMTDEHFGILSEKLEEPKSDEKVVILDGTKLNEEYVRSILSIT